MIMERGPAAQDISYYSYIEKRKLKTRNFVRYNIVHIYLNGKAFIIQNTGCNIEALLDIFKRCWQPYYNETGTTAYPIIRNIKIYISTT